MRAGLIPDPYLYDHERRLAWIRLTDWRYETTFGCDPDGAQRSELVFAFEVGLRPAEGGYLVTVSAHAFVRDVALLVDKLDPDAVVDGMLVTLFPGESVTWRVTITTELDLADVLAPTVLRSANQLR